MHSNGNGVSAKKILILSDGVTGHTHQAEAISHHVREIYRSRGIGPAEVVSDTFELDVKFKRRTFEKFLFFLGHPLAKFCRGCRRCFEYSLSRRDYLALKDSDPDVVISPFGRRVAQANLWLARTRGARSIVVMTPKFGVEKFDLAVVPRHDGLPPRENLVVTEGAPNLSDASWIESQAELLRNEIGALKDFKIGLLIGGDYKHFHMKEAVITRLLGEVRQAAECLDADLLATTSRRTPASVENILESGLSEDPRCRCLVIANKNNRAGVVPAMLGLCDVVVVSPESVSMISEAASSGTHVLVYRDHAFTAAKHGLFLENLAQKGYIRLIDVENLSEEIEDYYRRRERTKKLDDAVNIRAALERVIS
jgi:mitochondrial fission protein ELM1